MNKTATTLLIALALVMTSPLTHAGSATWNLNPATGDWNTATNWMPNTVPNNPADIATFGVSNRTDVSLSANVTVDSIVFNPGASSYNISVGMGSSATDLTLSGAGIVNNSGIVQNFVAAPQSPSQIFFHGSARAGVDTIFSNENGGEFGIKGEMFLDRSSADHAMLINDGSVSQQNDSPGLVQFLSNSTAGNATIINNPGVIGVGFTGFYDNSTAGNATVISNGGTASQHAGGSVNLSTESTGGQGTFIANGTDVPRATGGKFQCIFSATAGDATLIANGGTVAGGLIQFLTTTNGGNARVEVFGNGQLDASGQFSQTGTTIGSLEGDGQVMLGSNNLSIGGNSLSTTFAGVIADGQLAMGGSLTKVNNASLELSGANTYTGGTAVTGGTLIVSNTSGSATGTGQVQVVAGTLGGGGIISGAAVVGLGGGAGAFLAPAHGTKQQATLTIQSLLIFNSDGTYTYIFKAKGRKAKTDKVIANGVTINSGATFNLSGQTQGVLTPGLVLTVISNTSATPISGSFSNLPDGAIVSVNGNNLQASYEGGDGKDLTLTVVP